MTHAISPETIRGCAEQLHTASQDAEKCLAQLEEHLSTTDVANDKMPAPEMRDLLRRLIETLESTRHALAHELDPEHVDPTTGCPGCWSNGPRVEEVSQLNSSV